MNVYAAAFKFYLSLKFFDYFFNIAIIRSLIHNFFLQWRWYNTIYFIDTSI